MPVSLLLADAMPFQLDGGHYALLAVMVVGVVYQAVQKIWGANKGIAAYLRDWHEHKDAIDPHISLLRGEAFDELLSSKLAKWVTTDAFKAPVTAIAQHKIETGTQAITNVISAQVQVALREQILVLDGKIDDMRKDLRGQIENLVQRVDARIDHGRP